MELNRKIEFFFYNPKKSEEEYSQDYLSSGESIKGYSPLYLMLRHILLQQGKLFPFPKEVQQYPYFSALMIARTAIEYLMEISMKDEATFLRIILISPK